MQDKFSAEVELANKLREKLVEDDWSVIQLICSGGQAHFSISYKRDEKIKNIFPDVVAFNEDNIFIGEIKEKFDETDYFKLLELKSSEEGLNKLLNVISLKSGKNYQIEEIIFSLVHSQVISTPVKSIYQYVYIDDDFHFVLPHT